MNVTKGSRLLGAVAALVLVLPACDREPETDDQATGSVTGEEVRAARSDWSEAANMHVDSANAAYRADDLQGALRHYQAALEAAGDSKTAKVTAYFGIYMVQNALGDSVAAAAAMQEAQKLSPEASLMHGAMPMGGAGMGAPGATPPQTPNDSIHRRPQ